MDKVQRKKITSVSYIPPPEAYKVASNFFLRNWGKIMAKWNSIHKLHCWLSPPDFFEMEINRIELFHAHSMTNKYTRRRQRKPRWCYELNRWSEASICWHKSACRMFTSLIQQYLRYLRGLLVYLHIKVHISAQHESRIHRFLRCRKTLSCRKT
jgi:hypothetical protein